MAADSEIGEGGSLVTCTKFVNHGQKSFKTLAFGVIITFAKTKGCLRYGENRAKQGILNAKYFLSFKVH